MKTIKGFQYYISILLILFTSTICYFVSDFLPYKYVAFILLFCVSVLAMLFEIAPVLIAATLSALCWDFFFIEPRFTFSIGNTEDRFFLLFYFIIAMVNAVLSYKIRKFKKELSEKKNEEQIIMLYNTLFNSLSHELKTPIATILGATDSLKESSLQLSNENKSKLIDEISIATIRLNNQVENLLNMSRLESGSLKLKKDWVYMEELIYTVINKIDINKKNHQLIVDLPENLPLYKIDKVIVEQIIHNLLINALLYTPDFSKISISVLNERLVIDTNEVHKNDELILIISDNGPGFPSDEIEFVFDKFYRINHTIAGGTGLGLSIVKGFVEAQDGTITLENDRQGGAIFTINVPCEISYLNNLKNE